MDGTQPPTPVDVEFLQAGPYSRPLGLSPVQPAHHSGLRRCMVPVLLECPSMSRGIITAAAPATVRRRRLTCVCCGVRACAWQHYGPAPPPRPPTALPPARAFRWRRERCVGRGARPPRVAAWRPFLAADGPVRVAGDTGSRRAARPAPARPARSPQQLRPARALHDSQCGWRAARCLAAALAHAPAPADRGGQQPQQLARRGQRLPGGGESGMFFKGGGGRCMQW